MTIQLQALAPLTSPIEGDPQHSYWLAFRAFLHFVENPTSIEAVFAIAETLKSTQFQTQAIAHLAAIPEIQPLIQQRYLSDTPDLAALSELPPGSLGHSYALHIQQANLDPDFYPKMQVCDDASYLILRLRQTHDIWHVVTGFGTEGLGELQLQAFSLAQTHLPIAAAVLASGIWKILLQMPEHLDLLMQSLYRAYELGQNAKPLLAQRWEQEWEKPLIQWQRDLGIAINDRR
ncbi:Coq4 family protein [Scytonema sp. NUACC26]|uniref:Coq4 family protein n=1 Tax=Scytonema sp. NUACC26 TaxID=3140176 RepID=UPI0034DB9A8C